MLLAQIIQIDGEPVIYPVQLICGSWIGLTLTVRSTIDAAEVAHSRDAPNQITVGTGPAAGFTVEVDP